jgi:hypothetical protein
MEASILQELKNIKQLLTELMGTSGLPPDQRFSQKAISKAAKEFQKMAIARGEWIENHDIENVIKNAPWNCGQVIIEKFGFTNYFTQGKTLYFNKKDLQDLGKELKARNINLKDYVFLLEDHAKFQNYIANINNSKGKKQKSFKIPEELRDIWAKPYSAALEELIRTEIKTLMEEHKKFALDEYITFYEKKTFASSIYIYNFDRYLKDDLKKFIKDWCFKYNYANAALKKILDIKKESEIVNS